MRKIADESGQTLVISVLAMTVLCGFAALAADVGIMLHEKRTLQIAADSAAIEGAAEINYGDVVTAAQAAATRNGYTNGTGGAAIAVNYPPLYGPHAGKAGYVEVIASQRKPTLFMTLFGISALSPTARAVAENGGSSNGCVYVLNPTASDAMELQGSFDVSTPSCGIIVDSNSPNALDFTGGGGTLTAGSVGVVGGASGHTGDSTPAPVTGIVASSDPLNFITPPVPTGCTAPAGGKLTGTLPPPSGGIVCYSGAVTLSNVTLNTGTYVFTGNVTLSGNVSSTSGLTGGSTIDLNNGALSISTGTTLNLTAPQSGAYNGIALMQPLANTNQITIQKGDSSGSITGIIYAPGAELYLQDSGGDKSGGLSLTTDLIVNTLFDKTATLSITSYSQTVPGSPLTKVALVE